MMWQASTARPRPGPEKTWHGLARAVRRGLANMRIQAFLTAAVVNRKRRAALLAPSLAFVAALVGQLAAALARQAPACRSRAARA